METSCFVGTIFLCAWAVERQWWGRAGAFAALGSLFRPDGLALFAILLGYTWCGRVAGPRLRASTRACCSFIAVMLPLLGIVILLGGDLIPSSIGVKMAQSRIGWWATRRPWLIAWLRFRPAPEVTIPLAFWFLIRKYLLRQQVGLTFAMIFAITQMAVYTAISAPEAYFWYFTPSFVAFNLSALLGGIEVFELAKRKFTKMLGRAPTAPHATHERNWTLCGLGLAALYGSAGVPLQPPYYNSHDYKTVANWLALHSNPTDRTPAPRSDISVIFPNSRSSTCTG